MTANEKSNTKLARTLLEVLQVVDPTWRDYVVVRNSLAAQLLELKLSPEARTKLGGEIEACANQFGLHVCPDGMLVHAREVQMPGRHRYPSTTEVNARLDSKVPKTC